MICSKCGNEGGNSRFCMNCGAPLQGNGSVGNGSPNMGYRNSYTDPGRQNAGYGGGNMGGGPNMYGGGNMGSGPNMYGGGNMGGGGPNMYGGGNMGGGPNMYGGGNMGGGPNMGYRNVYTGAGNPNIVYGTAYDGFGAPSGFDGEGAEYLGIYIINALVLFFTLGIAYPWVYCRNLHWRKHHTIINGRRLAFTGTAGELFANWIIWWLLCLVTCGIYGFWVSVRMHQWEMAHTCYADMNPVMGQTFEDSFYDGEVGTRLGESLVAGLMVFFSCGIATPWAIVRIHRYDMAHSVINGDRLVFNGDGAGYWGENCLIGLLNFITCSLYYSWGIVRINRWFYQNTHVYSSGNIRNPYRM